MSFNATQTHNSATHPTLKPMKNSLYDFYVQVAVMMFVGFGYLMTFLKSYGFSAVGLTMFITCVGGQWALLLETLMTTGCPFPTGFEDFLNMNFAVAAVLISFGAVIGKMSPLQLLILTLVEPIFYCLNKVYLLGGEHFDGFVDCGGTIIIHVFGAYFGLACAYMFGRAKDKHVCCRPLFSCWHSVPLALLAKLCGWRPSTRRGTDYGLDKHCNGTPCLHCDHIYSYTSVQWKASDNSAHPKCHLGRWCLHWCHSKFRHGPRWSSSRGNYCRSNLRYRVQQAFNTFLHRHMRHQQPSWNARHFGGTCLCSDAFYSEPNQQRISSSSGNR